MAIELLTPPTLATHSTRAMEDLTLLAPDPFALLDHRSKLRSVLASQAMPGHYLALEDADGVSHLIDLDRASTRIGRATGSDVRLENIHISRHHAIVTRSGRHVRILDDRSSAGTWVNGQRVIAVELGHGDRIRLGPVTLTYRHVR